MDGGPVIRSNDPMYKVSPEVLAQNFVVMGNLPPVSDRQTARKFVERHGEPYALAVFAKLRDLGYTVEYP